MSRRGLDQQELRSETKNEGFERMYAEGKRFACGLPGGQLLPGGKQLRVYFVSRMQEGNLQGRTTLPLN